MTEGLQASIDRDLLPEWRKQKDEAYQDGMDEGSRLLGSGYMDWSHWHDPYLQYLYLLGVGQAIANAGRDIVGAENLAAKANDVEGKARK